MQIGSLLRYSAFFNGPYPFVFFADGAVVFFGRLQFVREPTKSTCVMIRPCYFCKLLAILLRQYRKPIFQIFIPAKKYTDLPAGFHVSCGYLAKVCNTFL